MAIGGIGAVGPGGLGGIRPDFGGAAKIGGGQDFGEMVKAGLQNVSDAEQSVDQVAQTIATGGPAEIHDLMAASSKAQILVELLVQVRNKAVEAYQEIMRIQV
jgi:flagellar hook-basal body complex protein FliE